MTNPRSIPRRSDLEGPLSKRLFFVNCIREQAIQVVPSYILLRETNTTPTTEILTEGWCGTNYNEDQSIQNPHSGLLLAIAGTALAQGEWRGLLALATAVIAWAIKAKKEGSWLQDEFGVQFDEYRQSTGFLLPRLRQ